MTIGGPVARSTTGPVARVLSALGPNAKIRATPSGYLALCPAHEDHRASLSIGVGDDGRVLLKCHAGCNNPTITATIGLKMRDLMPDSPTHMFAPRRRLVAAYTYTDEAGEPLFQVCRFEPKDFRQRHRAKPGEKADREGWAWTTAGIRRVLYNLPALVPAVAASRASPDVPPIWVVEGEKDADALVQLGAIATTSPGGAQKWRSEYAATLAGARVVVIADKDQPGRAHAAMVAASVPGAKVVEVPVGKDAADWIASGAKLADFEQLAAEAPVWTPPAAETSDAPQITLTPPPPPTPIGDGRVVIPGVVPNSIASIEVLLRDHRDLIFGSDDPIRLNRLSEEIDVGAQPWDLEELATEVRISTENNVHCETKKLDEQGRPVMAMLRLVEPDVRRVLVRLARQNAYSPVHEWLAALPAVQPGAIALAANEALGLAPGDSLSPILWRKWLIGAVARVYQPGCQLDSVLVLVAPGGGQRKSQSLRALVGPDWYSDTHLDLVGFGRKDAYQQMHRVWVQEIAELESPGGERERARIKSFITSPSDDFRASYDRRVLPHKRSLALAATSNSLAIFAPDDPAYNRRLWAMRIATEIDTDMLAGLRPEIWAEARDAYLAGEPWHLVDDEESALLALSERQGDLAAEADPLGERVVAWAEHIWPAGTEEPIDRLTMTRLLSEGGQLRPGEQTVAAARRVGAAMRAAGWVSYRATTADDRGRAWRRA